MRGGDERLLGGMCLGQHKGGEPSIPNLPLTDCTLDAAYTLSGGSPQCCLLVVRNKL